MILKRMFGCDNIKSKREISLTKADVWLLAAVLAAAFLLLFAFHAVRKPGSRAVVSYDGGIVLELSLSRKEADYYLVLWKTDSAGNAGLYRLSPDAWETEAEALTEAEGVEAYNLFVCENGEVRMMQSSCPDLICVRHKAVSKTGETIVCLPHKLVIEITGAPETELDGVVY